MSKHNIVSANLNEFADTIIDSTKKQVDKLKEEAESLISKTDYIDNTFNYYTQPIIKDKLPNRNDLCPCGSGKKYKKCCINK